MLAAAFQLRLRGFVEKCDSCLQEHDGVRAHSVFGAVRTVREHAGDLRSTSFTF